MTSTSLCQKTPLKVNNSLFLLGNMASKLWKGVTTETLSLILHFWSLLNNRRMSNWLECEMKVMKYLRIPKNGWFMDMPNQKRIKYFKTITLFISLGRGATNKQSNYKEIVITSSKVVMLLLPNVVNLVLPLSTNKITNMSSAEFIVVTKLVNSTWQGLSQKGR